MYVLAAELRNISPSAYIMLRNSGSVVLSRIELIKQLLTEYNFNYELPDVFAGEALEKFFGQARKCSGGNFYTDAVDIKAAAETKNLHTLLK